MSPSLRSMLTDAADDSARPTSLDLDAVRAGGRRATWRRRATVGGLAAGVTAIVATVAITLGGMGSTAQVPADQAPPDQPDGALVLEAAGVNGSALALLDAIRSAGYDLDLSGATGSGSEGAAGSGSDGGTSSSAAAMTFGLVRGDTRGSLVLADFTAIAVLAGLASVPDTDGPMCAVEPGVSEGTAFGWAACDRQPFVDGEIWSSEGTGTDVDAVGATLVRGDGSGFSVTLATVSGGWFAYGPTAPVLTPLAALPLTSAELADVVAKIAAFDEPLLADFHGEPALPNETAMPSPAPTEIQTQEPTQQPADCAQGDVLATMTDDLGHTDLVDRQGRTLLCSYRFDEHYPSDVFDISDEANIVALPSAGSSPDEPWSFSPQTDMVCDPPASCTVVGLGYGEVPADVARITFAKSDGIEVDAPVTGNWWFFRFIPSASGGLEAPTVVRLYDSADRLLAVGEAADRGAVDPTVTGSPVEPVDGG